MKTEAEKKTKQPTKARLTLSANDMKELRQTMDKVHKESKDKTNLTRNDFKEVL